MQQQQQQQQNTNKEVSMQPNLNLASWNPVPANAGKELGEGGSLNFPGQIQNNGLSTFKDNSTAAPTTTGMLAGQNFAATGSQLSMPAMMSNVGLPQLPSGPFNSLGTAQQQIIGQNFAAPFNAAGGNFNNNNFIGNLTDNQIAFNSSINSNKQGALSGIAGLPGLQQIGQSSMNMASLPNQNMLPIQTQLSQSSLISPITQNLQQQQAVPGQVFPESEPAATTTGQDNASAGATQIPTPAVEAAKDPAPAVSTEPAAQTTPAVAAAAISTAAPAAAAAAAAAAATNPAEPPTAKVEHLAPMEDDTSTAPAASTEQAGEASVKTEAGIPAAAETAAPSTSGSTSTAEPLNLERNGKSGKKLEAAKREAAEEALADESLQVDESIMEDDEPEQPEPTKTRRRVPRSAAAASRVNMATAPQLLVLYTPGGALPSLARYDQMLVEVRVQAKYLSTKNREVQRRQLWGSGVYTDDSDTVAVLMHSGRMILRAAPPTGCLGVSAVFRVLPPSKDGYKASTQYNYRSREWSGSYDRTSLQLVRSEPIHNPALFQLPKAKKDESERRRDRRDPNILQQMVVNSKRREPESSKKDKKELKRKMIPDVVIVFNSSNDPCLKYSLGLVGDRGMDQNEWTSNRLKKEVIYLESATTRYELARCRTSETNYDSYRWAEVIATPAASTPHIEFANQPSGKKQRTDSSVPLKKDKVVVLEDKLDWGEIEWGPTSVRVRGKSYQISTVQFMKMT